MTREDFEQKGSIVPLTLTAAPWLSQASDVLGKRMQGILAKWSTKAYKLLEKRWGR